MGLLQTILVALIPVALIAWRLRRMVNVLRGGGSSWKKIAIAALIGIGVLSRVARLVGTSDADASPVTVADSVAFARLAQANQLLGEGEAALSRCDTAAATYAFQRVAGVGVDMMSADSLDGEAYFIQAAGLAGLHDGANAKILMAESRRLHRLSGIDDESEHAEVMNHITAIAGKGC